MLLKGKLFAESPIYRGNARKTLFTRDGDGTQRLVSLAGEIAGTAQTLMDAFIGSSRTGANIGLLNHLWLRLYKSPMPSELIKRVQCTLREECYPRDRLFDLRMGIRLDEDRWAAEANANYKYETLFRNAVFDFKMEVNDALLQQNENATRLYYVLEELKAGRFWFGAGKSKGLGRCRLEMDPGLPAPATVPSVNHRVNHLTIHLRFNTSNPVLVGWNWGKLDPTIPTFAAIEGRLLIEAMRTVPEPIRQRLAMSIGGPILSPEDWKKKLAEYLPKIIAIWLREQSTKEVEGWAFPKAAINKLGKGKHPLSKKILDSMKPLVDKPFPSQDAAKAALDKVLGKKSHMANRILEVLTQTKQTTQEFDHEAWRKLAGSLELEGQLAEQLAPHITNEAALVKILVPVCTKILPSLYLQVDRQIKLLRSDPWIDVEIANREEHIRIKEMLLNGRITEQQWKNPASPPEGIRAATWKEFLDSHSRVDFHHMLQPKNLQKSLSNDRNQIALLKAYRDRVRQELSQPYHTDFRVGGVSNREISRKYGKAYDTIFMRMLTWAPSSKETGRWEVYIPGSTIKGAFRKRASQVLKTLWGESPQTNARLDRLFGTQGERGLVFFSDAYLADPQIPEQVWCSMDGVRMDPKTAQPIEEAKADYLYAYGDKLTFHLRLDLQDLDEKDMEIFVLLRHLLQDFQRGDIPLGGEKTCGFGWVKAEVTEVHWLTADRNGIGKKLIGEHTLAPDGIWHSLKLSGETAAKVLHPASALSTGEKKIAASPVRAGEGFISHRAFGGYCGELSVVAEVLTPICVQESGEPSFTARLDDGPIHGHDFFSMAPPEAGKRGAQKIYALPAKSIKGMLRHIYTIASDSIKPSADLSHLNPVDSLFGFVGAGPNQALMGRLAFGFGIFEKPELAWFKAPYPYGAWQFIDGEWKNIKKGRVPILRIAGEWRLFPHAPLAPNVTKLEDFHPDTAQATYMRAILPGAKCRFTIRFWNLEQQELQRLIWCLALEPTLAHKMGRGRYLGFGSLRLHIQPESFLTDWANRYTNQNDQAWRLPIKVEEWINPSVIAHYSELQKALNAQYL
ncbi:MAG: RAMP superfamily CRISPR-associated protein [candidate division KSB1 bacterium]|nr:RAMP superfamily CRISPR-associated protein [candidate division KSB1 bacterium]MDZ7301784.1 RAMP superfamily CRISPR-associated protein [candidate division KSB1 bacterium]MDZ7311437.1 RAMP superfamily CRISPR-associated protein [candidate division KSB1 bacterium]